MRVGIGRSSINHIFKITKIGRRVGKERMLFSQFDKLNEKRLCNPTQVD